VFDDFGTLFAYQQVWIVTKAGNSKTIGGVMHKKLRIIWLATFMLALSMRPVAFAEDTKVSTGQACEPTSRYACLFEKDLIFSDISNSDGVENAKHTPLNPKLRSVALGQSPKPEMAHKPIQRSHPKLSNELASHDPLVENEFEDIAIDGYKDDDYVVGLTFSFKRFSLKSFCRSILSAIKQSNTTWAGNLPSVSLYIELPDF